MLANASEYIKRRKQVMREIGKDAIAVISASREIIRNGDSDYPFRQDSNFYYLTGFNEPDACLVLIPGRSEGEVVLFNRERNPEMEVWTGFRAGQKGACETYGADQSFPISELDNMLPKLMENCQKIYYLMGQNEKFDQRMLASYNKIRSQVRGIGRAHV